MQMQVAYISRLPEWLEDVDPILVCWGMLHDVTAFDYRFLTTEQQLSIQSRFGISADILFERLNHMALFKNDGTPKPGYFAALDVFGYDAIGANGDQITEDGGQGEEAEP